MKLSWKRRIGIYGGLAALSVATLSLAGQSPAGADQVIVHTFKNVACTAVVGGQTLTQTQDVTLGVVAPDSVTPNGTFTLTFPGGSAGLPTRSNGLSITSYSNLFQTVQLNGANFSGGIVNPGFATFVPSTLSASSWSNLTSFALNAYVYIDEAPVTTPPTPPDYHFFKSLVAANTGHAPATSPGQWVEVQPSEVTTWQSTVSYAINVYTSSGGVIYKSLAASNLGNAPASSPTKWQAQSAAQLSTAQTVTNPAANQMKYGNPGPIPAGNPADPATLALTTPTISINATAPASGSVTLQMVSLTTHLLLNGVLNADATCNVPPDIVLTIPVTTATTTTSTSTTSTSTSTSTSSSTSTSTSTSTTSTSTSTTSTSTSTTVPCVDCTTTTSTSTTTTSAPTTTTSTSTTTAPTTTTSTSTTTSTTTAPTTTTSTSTSTTAAPTTTTTAAPTTTTTTVPPSTTTTTVPAKPIAVVMRGTNTNACVSTVYLGPPSAGNVLIDPAAAAVNLTLAATAFPDPHRGLPIQLTKSSATISVGADVLQAGVDSTPPLITDGMKVPSTLTLIVTGSNTTEGQHTYTVKSTATIHVKNGQAQPLNISVPLPNTVWHPKSKALDVTFAEKSMNIASQINILGGLTAVFACKPGPSLRLSPSVGAQSTVTATTVPPTEPTTVAANGSTATTAAVATTGAASGSGTSSGDLPRTGASWVLLLVLAAAAIDIGIVMIGATRRRFRHR